MEFLPHEQIIDAKLGKRDMDFRDVDIMSRWHSCMMETRSHASNEVRSCVMGCVDMSRSLEAKPFCSFAAIMVKNMRTWKMAKGEI